MVKEKNNTNNESFDYNQKNNSYTNISENRYYELMMNSNKKNKLFYKIFNLELLVDKIKP